MTTKLCKRCNREKPLDEFLPKKARRGRYARCMDCVSSTPYTKPNPEEKPALNAKARKRYHGLTPKQRWAETAMKNCYSRAKTYNIPVDLTLEGVKALAVDVCPLLGVPIVYGQGRIAPNGPSIDRKDPSKGYVLENLWVVSTRANRIKNDATSEELFIIAAALREAGL